VAATGDVGIQIAKRAWASLHGLLFGTNFFCHVYIYIWTDRHSSRPTP